MLLLVLVQPPPVVGNYRVTRRHLTCSVLRLSSVFCEFTRPQAIDRLLKGQSKSAPLIGCYVRGR